MQYLLDHIHLRCSDLEGAIAYYKKIFDAKEVGRGDAKGMPVVGLEMAGQRFAFSPKRDGVHTDVKPGDPGWGLYQIGLKVDNLDAAIQELKERGAEISRGPLEVNNGLRVFFVEGPDAVEIEVMEYD
ncbi:glyoxalase family protein [delta proteobacterium NaphS2]|nr:glyoxalase family protein [delta proteobacterium NaphS2]